MRLNALEAIELIIREKMELERYRKKKASAHKKLRRSSGPMPTVWGNCASIYKWLSHYYIQRRSVVFIVDTQFDSFFFRDRVMKYVNDYFSDELDDKDYFGFISLDEATRAGHDEIILDKRSASDKIKKNLLRGIANR